MKNRDRRASATAQATKTRPTWREGRTNRRPLTAAEARDEDTERAKRIERAIASGNSAVPSKALKEVSKAIRRGDPGSAAGIVNRRTFQKWFVETGLAYLETKRGPFAVLSIVPSQIYPFGSLIEGNPYQHLRVTAKQALREAGIPWAIGAIDVSENEHQSAKFEPHYQFHVWCLVPAWPSLIATWQGDLQAARTDSKRLALLENFPPTAIVKRPVKIQQFDGRPNALAYALKIEPCRRVTIPKLLDANGNTLARQNTRLRAMRVAQEIEVMALFHRFGLWGPLLLMGTRHFFTNFPPN